MCKKNLRNVRHVCDRARRTSGAEPFLEGYLPHDEVDNVGDLGEMGENFQPEFGGERGEATRLSVLRSAPSVARTEALEGDLAQVVFIDSPDDHLEGEAMYGVACGTRAGGRPTRRDACLI